MNVKEVEVFHSSATPAILDALANGASCDEAIEVARKPYTVDVYYVQAGWEPEPPTTRQGAWDLAKWANDQGNPCKVYCGKKLVWTNKITVEDVEDNYSAMFEAAVFGVR